MSDEKKSNTIGGFFNKGKQFSKDLGKVFSDGEKFTNGINKVINEGAKFATDAAAAVKDPEFQKKVSDGFSNAVESGKTIAEKTFEAGKTGIKLASDGTKKAVETGKALGEKVQSKTEEVMTSDEMVKTLDVIYDKAMNGVPKVSKSVDDLADSYLSKTDDPNAAAKSLINNQILKCTTSGFLSGLGGVVTLPVTLPANVTSVLYVQLRMIAAIAKIGGFDPSDDQVQALVYACLTGQAIGDILKGAGIKLGQKFAAAGINKITGAALTRINQAVGFRLITKFGETGIINLGKMIPVVGGIVGGGFDLVTTKVIAANAYKLFIEKSTDFKTNEDINVIDAEIICDNSDSSNTDVSDIYNVYSDEENYVQHVIEACKELDIPYRETKVQRFIGMSVKCSAIKLVKLHTLLSAYGEYEINEVTSDETATIQSWAE